MRARWSRLAASMPMNSLRLTSCFIGSNASGPIRSSIKCRTTTTLARPWCAGIARALPHTGDGNPARQGAALDRPRGTRLDRRTSLEIGIVRAGFVRIMQSAEQLGEEILRHLGHTQRLIVCRLPWPLVERPERDRLVQAAC